MRVPLSLACGAYDRTAALARGDIRPWVYAEAERTRDVMGADLKDLRPGRERGHAGHVRPVLLRAGPDQPGA